RRREVGGLCTVLVAMARGQRVASGEEHHGMSRPALVRPDRRVTLKRSAGTLPSNVGGHMSRPLLVIDADSLAHRAYHAVPKTVRRAGNKGGGAIVGFANYLIRLVTEEKPRAVVVGWDTLEAPNWRALELEGYQGGRVFEDEIVEQLSVLPEFV